MEQSTTVTFLSSSSVSEGSLKIKQEEWEENTGFITKANLYSILYNNLRNSATSGIVNCGMDSDTSLSATIYVYPNPENLNYQLYTSYGVLSPHRAESFVQKERIDFSVSDTGTLGFSVPSNITYTWEGVVRDSTGATIDAPSVSFDWDAVTLSQKVYGTLFVQYNVPRHVYTLGVQARTEDEEVSQDAFGAVIYGVYSGGISWIEMEPPPFATELAGGEECGNVKVVRDDDDEEDPYTPPKYAPTIEKVSTWDYCSGELLSFTETQVG